MVAPYLNNIVIYDRKSREHNDILYNVLQRIEECELHVKREKGEYSLPQIRYWGFIYEKDGIRPDPSTIEGFHE